MQHHQHPNTFIPQQQPQQGLPYQQQQVIQQQGQQYGQQMMYPAMPHAQYLQQQQPMQASRTASATPPPGLQQQQQMHTTAGMNQLQHAVPQQQQQPQVAHDDQEFDLNDIPSPGSSPTGAGAGPAQPGASSQASSAATIQQQHQAAQQQQAHLLASQRGALLQQQQQQHHQRQDAQAQALAAHHQQQFAMRQHQHMQRHPAAALPQAAPNRHLVSIVPGQNMAGRPGPAGSQAMAVGTADAARLAQQRAAAAVAAAQAPKASGDTKRPKAADVLPAAPDDAVSLQDVLRKAARAGGLPAVTNAGPAAAAAAASGAAAEGPSSTIDEILRKAENQVKADSAAAAAVGSGAIRGRGGERATDDSKIISDFALRRILELQGLNKAFKLQPELVDQLQRLTQSFVQEAVDFGVSLASRRRGATLRPTDLSLYLDRTHHLHVPGFTKEYHPYRRPAASDLHRERSALVRKAQLHSTAGGEGGTGGARGGGGGGE